MIPKDGFFYPTLTRIMYSFSCLPLFLDSMGKIRFLSQGKISDILIPCARTQQTHHHEEETTQNNKKNATEIPQLKQKKYDTKQK